MLLSPTLGDFVPQTPVRPRFSHQQRRHHRSDSSSSSFTTTSSTPSRPSTPVTPTSQRNGHEGSRGHARSKSRDTSAGEEEKEETGTPKATLSTGRRTSTSCLIGAEDEDEEVEETRTGEEKREMLQKLMGNVEALEERFRAMGLS